MTHVLLSLVGDSLSRRSLPVPFACFLHLLIMILEPSLLLLMLFVPAVNAMPAVPAACAD
jgi:hypothetical protein